MPALGTAASPCRWLRTPSQPGSPAGAGGSRDPGWPAASEGEPGPVKFPEVSGLY